MFGLSKETKLDFLVGGELQQIAFSQFQLILHFSRGAEVSIESRLALKPADSPSVASVWEPEKFSDLAGFATIIGASIVSYEIPGDGRLVLRFGNGAVLTAYDSNIGHESYQITGGGQTVVV
jgi:hypothetical protein